MQCHNVEKLKNAENEYSIAYTWISRKVRMANQKNIRSARRGLIVIQSLALCAIPAFWYHLTGIWYFHVHEVSGLEILLRWLWMGVLPVVFLVGALNSGVRGISFLILLGYILAMPLLGMTGASTDSFVRSFLKGIPPYYGQQSTLKKFRTN